MSDGWSKPEFVIPLPTSLLLFMQAIMINEFTSHQWQNKPYPGSPGVTLGDGVLTSRAFPTEYWWVWVAVGANFLATTVFNIILIIAHAWLPGKNCRMY